MKSLTKNVNFINENLQFFSLGQYSPPLEEVFFGFLTLTLTLLNS